jgi:selenocysteine-specific elongation factor
VTDIPPVAAGDRDAPPHVVATAGHVDHGKSNLILRLTGMDPDRLEEEKRRGLTIDLGFAWCTLPSGREVGFVDVPGHERFVRTMLAGVGPVRLILFVVAADEGWGRQSEEHLAIVDVLGVDGAVVALTKRDLVDAQRLAAARSDVADRLRGTALEAAPVVACSSASGEGIPDLVTALDTMVSSAPAGTPSGRARQFIDRVFTIAGAGTVATGTLVQGHLAVGDEVEILPAGVRARVRGLQTHRRRIESARPVARVAVNLAGVDRARVERGDVLAGPGEWRPTAVLEARIRPVRGLAHAVTSKGAFTFHAGAAERGATLRLYGASSLSSDGAFARIRLSAPLVLDVHDRFVLRESGRRETVAGGIVLEPAPPRRPGADAMERLARRELADRSELPALVLAERGAVRDVDLAVLTGLGAVDGSEPTGRWWIDGRVRDDVGRAVSERLRELHEAAPAAEGADAGEVRSAVLETLRRLGAPADRDLADTLLDELVRGGEVVRSGPSLRLASHRAGVTEAEVDRVVAAVRAGEPTPPTIAELVRGGFARETIDAAVRMGALVRVASDLVLTPGLVALAIDAVREAGPAGVTVSAIRQRLGTSRRFAVPLLEYLDRTGETRRSGDLRFPRGT